MKQSVKEFWQIIKQVITAPVPDISQNFDQEVIESDRRARSFGYSIVALILVGFGGWGAIAPLESAAIGAGTVKVEGDSKPIQHLEGGIVAEILVENGDYVTNGQALLRLDTTQFEAELSIIQARLWAKQAMVDRLKAERAEVPSISFSPVLANESDYRARMAMENERALFNARRADRLGEVAVLDQRIKQLEEQVRGSKEVIGAKDSVAASLSLEIAELNTLLIEGYVDKQRIRELDRSLAQTLGQIAELNAQVARSLVVKEETHLQIAQLTKRFVSDVVDELSRTQDEIFDLEQRFTAAADKVNRATVRAPASGYIMALEPNTAGAVIGSGQPIMEVVPDVDRLVIDVRMSPMDIDRIRIGQEAEVTFAVFKDSYSITGELVKLSADTMLDDASGAPYYKGSVTLKQSDLDLLGDDLLVPGMPASVLVKTGSRTLLGYLTSPLQRMFERSLTED